jgi:SAM-dependent methyltransferase
MESRGRGGSAEPASWAGLAAHWQAVATPLRPSAADAAFVQQVIDSQSARASLRVLLLGVTPELSGLRYPADAALLAVDSSPDMLAAWWTPPRDCASLAVCARWENIPLAPASIDLVLADASFCALADVRNMREVLGVVATAMRPGALLCGRTFVSPPRPENVEAVVRDLRAGRAGSVHAAKWRVAMALQGHAENGVALAEVWQVFERAGNRQSLAALNGWSAASAATLDAYRGVSSRLCFPTLALTRQLFAAHFDELECRWPDYELGERCPSLLLRRR